MSLSELVQALPADVPEEEHQLARVRQDSAALLVPCNKSACRALAKQGDVPQKRGGQIRSIEEIRNEVEQKIRQEVDRLLRKAHGNEKPGENVPGAEEPGEREHGRSSLWC